ncbi:unnamed protein product, partial [Iphiclides podalirius]
MHTRISRRVSQPMPPPRENEHVRHYRFGVDDDALLIHPSKSRSLRLTPHRGKGPRQTMRRVAALVASRLASYPTPL